MSIFTERDPNSEIEYRMAIRRLEKKEEVEESVKEKVAMMTLQKNGESDETEHTRRVDIESALPFSALSPKLSQIGWKEEILLGENEQPQSKRISWPTENMEMYTFKENDTNLQEKEYLRYVELVTLDNEDIKKGKYTLPVDAWNLDNFASAHFMTRGDNKYSFMNIMESFYDDLKASNEETQRERIIFSKDKNQIILLPSIKSHE